MSDEDQAVFSPLSQLALTPSQVYSHMECEVIMLFYALNKQVIDSWHCRLYHTPTAS